MLSISSDDYFLEEADSHIQANLGDSVVKEALKSGVDLREYSAQVWTNLFFELNKNKSGNKNDCFLKVENELKEAENLSIQDYIRESQNIASLHHQVSYSIFLSGPSETVKVIRQSSLLKIVECDQILENMQKILMSFQTDLGSISNEILTLQQESVQV